MPRCPEHQRHGERALPQHRHMQQPVRAIGRRGEGRVRVQRTGRAGLAGAGAGWDQPAPGTSPRGGASEGGGECPPQGAMPMPPNQ